MTLATPAWQPFDPSTDGLPASLRNVFTGGEGGVVVVGVAPSVDPDWAARVSVRIAEVFSERGSGVLLVDLGLEDPSLEEALGGSWAEGISDVFLFGASVHRVTYPVRDGAFTFAPAGTVVGDPAAVRTHPNWDAVLRTYVGSGILVLLHVPLGVGGTDQVLARADRLVLLGGPSDTPDGAVLEAFQEGLAWMGPPLVGGTEAAADLEDPYLADPLAADPLDPDAAPPVMSHPDDGALDAAAAAGPGPLGPEDAAPGGGGEPAPADWAPQDPEPSGVGAMGAAPDDAASEEEPADPFWDQATAGGTAATGAVGQAPSDADPGGRRSSPLRVAVLALVVVAVAVAGLLAVLSRDQAPAEGAPPETSESLERAQSRPAGGPDAGGAAGQGAGLADTDPEIEDPTPQPEMPPAAPAVMDASTPYMAFGLAIASYEAARAETARNELREIQAYFPELRFVLVPVQVNGADYLRVLAGPAATQTEAEELREPLASYLGQGAAGRAFVRATRVAYLLGEFESLADAEESARLAWDQDIPAYAAEIDTNLGPRYRVYAGAYANESEAAPLARLLPAAAMEEAPLVELRGRSPQ